MPIPMKRSRYNRVVQIDGEDRFLLFNGVTAGLVSFDRQLFQKVQEIMNAVEDGGYVPEDEAGRNIYATLVDGRFIVPKSVDELDLLKVRYNASRFNDRLSLTILPTLACNLACTYCYERARPESMTRETMDAICAFVEDRARRERIDRFHVSWYGGEPLLTASTVWELSESFLKLSEQYGFRYTASMTTNGTLLTKEVADNLLRYNVTSMQVTVDGPKEVHDARRPFKSTQGSSFDAILGNLEHVVGRLTVAARVNTDKRNAGAAVELLKVFADKGWLGESKRFYPYMAAVAKMTEVCADIAHECCTVESFFDLSMDFCKACAAYGVPIKTHALYHFPVAMKYNCGAIALNTMVVNPSGAIYKCGLTVSDESESLGNIREPMDLVNPNLLKWLSYDPFDVEECRECDLLPICLGGCPKRVLEGEHPTQGESCEYTKKNIDSILILHGG